MGDRANVQIVEEQGGTLYLYTHWQGTELPQLLAKALDAGRGRWGDETYLSRIILSQIVKDDWQSETGFGLSTYRTDYEYDDLEVHMADREVIDRDGAHLSFDQFIEKHKNGAES